MKVHYIILAVSMIAAAPLLAADKTLGRVGFLGRNIAVAAKNRCNFLQQARLSRGDLDRARASARRRAP
jgi:hypothetical protein